MGANGAGGYNLTDSLRFRRSASARLTRTFASTGTNNKIQTFSAWVKRGNLSSSSTYRLMGGYDGSSTNSTEINFVNDQLRIEFGGSASNSLVTTSKYRDPSAWYHIVVVIDTTQATSTNRVKLYVNDSQITAFDTANYPAQNAVSQLTSANANNSVGAGWGGFDYFDGYLTEVNFVDGQVLTPSDFGEYNEDTGVWKPKKYTGTYGTNGFYLKGRGTDNSGNGNNWTENNFNTSNSALTTYDIMTDVPTLTDEDTANYAVINPLNSSTTTVPTTSNANLRIVGTVNAYQGMYMSMAIPSTGKWYFEYTYETKQGLGGNQQTLITPSPSLSGSGATSDSTTLYGLYSNSNYQYGSTGQTDLGIAAVAGNTQMVAYDSDTGKLWWGYNGTWFLSGNPSAGTNPLATQTASIEKYIANVTYGTGGTTSYNFGQRPFAYTPPTGYLKLNTFNLPDSNIVDGSQYMNTLTWTGDGTSSRSITGLGFQPDLVWWKNRTTARWHQLFDSVRGADKALSSNATDAEDAAGGYGGEGSVTSFDSDGFTLQGGVGNNESSSGIVGWSWRGSDSSAVSNTAGTIASTVSANTDSGFSIVKYAGNSNASATVGHGLGVQPKMVIVKRLEGGYHWMVGILYNGVQHSLYLNNPTAQDNELSRSPQAFTNTTFRPSSIVAAHTNGTGSNYVAYCFANVEGFSKFGSYTGNGSADGPFVYTGFRPAFIMVKRTDGVTSWFIHDTARDTYNVANKNLYPNLSAAEEVQTTWNQDMLSNGFKTRGASTELNASGGTYIYMAFAENPFKNSLAR